MNFWDTSALVPLRVDEAHTSAVRVLYDRDDHLVVWWGTSLECTSALTRAVRQGRLSLTAALRAANELRVLLEAADEVGPTTDVRERAERLLSVHPLRAADALQLGAALIWARERTAGMGFVCLDERLRESARREGFAALPAQADGR
jgi:uncharacterized protein